MLLRFLLFVFFAGSCLSSFAQNEDYLGIDFGEEDFSTTLKEAATSNKLVFIDAFTTWCGPCKKLKRDIFPDSVVGKFFNQHFLNLEINMEKGEGIELAKKYHVKAYPTLLFVNSQGNVVHRATGFHTVEELLDLGHAAIDPNRQLITLENRFAAGEKNSEFLFQYAQVRFDLADDSYDKVADAYLQTQPNWGEEKNIRFIFKFLNKLDSKAADYFVKNRKRFEEKFGMDIVEQKIQDLVFKKINADQDTLLQGLDTLIAKIYPTEKSLMVDKFSMKYFREAEKIGLFANAADKYFKKQKNVAATEMNDAAFAIMDGTDEKKLLKKAVKWATTSVEKEPTLTNYETVVGLYYKLGKKSKALNFAKEAIEIGRKSGENYSMMNDWIEKINKL